MKSKLLMIIFLMSTTFLFSQAVNDECADRETITVETTLNTYSFDSSEATETLDASCDNASNNNLDVWYEFEMPVDGNVRITGIPNTVLRTLYDSCGGVELACGSDDGFFYDLNSNTTYVLRLAERDIFAGIVNFNIQAFAKASNDECAALEIIDVETTANTYSIDTRGATESLNSSCQSESNDNLDVWFEFTMPVDGNVRITGIPNTINSTLYDSCGSSELLCEFDDTFFYSLAASTTYVLRLSERAIFAGTVDFTIQAFETAANNECVNRETIAVETTANTYSIDTRAATESLNSSCQSESNDNLDVWFEFTMPVDGNVRITGIPNTINSTLYDSCGSSELLCEFDDTFFYSLTASTTYVLRLSERAIFAGTVDFTIQAFASTDNDECTGALTISPGITAPVEVLFDNRGFTESLDASCETAGNINMDGWYTFVMPVDGDIEFSNASANTSFALYDACGGTEISCSFGNTSFFNLEGNTQYFLRASRRALFANEANFRIQVLPSPLPPCSSTTEWISPGQWNNGIPDLSVNAILRVPYDTADNGSFSSCTLAIDTGTTLIISEGDYVEIASDITVNGTLDINHQGSIVQRDDLGIVTNNGTIRVHTTSPAIGFRGFMVIGSPMTTESREDVWSTAFQVRNHIATNFVPNNDVALAFPLAENFADDNNDNWPVYETGVLNPGFGYLVRPQTGFNDPGGIYDYIYNQGTLNNGEISFPIVYNTPGPTDEDNRNASPNVLANPYASAISARDFINSNSMVNEVFFWEHNTPPSADFPGANTINFTMEDISMFNLAGGIAAPTGGTTPTDFIASTQGFGIKATEAGTAIFNNSMRRATGNNTLRNPETPQDRIWLELVQSDYNLKSNMLIAFSDNSSDDLDVGYDSKRLASAVSLYSHLQNGSEELGIQSLARFSIEKTVPIGFSSQIEEDANFIISIKNVEGVLLNQSIYLLDNLTQQITDLSKGDFKFTSNSGNFTNRFTLLFTNNALSIEENKIDKPTIYPNPSKDIISVNYQKSIISKIVLLDMNGRVMLSRKTDTSNAQIDITDLAKGIYLMQLISESGTFTERIIKN